MHGYSSLIQFNYVVLIESFLNWRPWVGSLVVVLHCTHWIESIIKNCWNTWNRQFWKTIQNLRTKLIASIWSETPNRQYLLGSKHYTKFGLNNYDLTCLKVFQWWTHQTSAQEMWFVGLIFVMKVDVEVVAKNSIEQDIIYFEISKIRIQNTPWI